MTIKDQNHKVRSEGWSTNCGISVERLKQYAEVNT